MLKQGRACVLYYTTKVRLGSYIVQKAKVRYGWGFLRLKMINEGTAGFYLIEEAKIRYRWGFNLFKILK